MNSYVKNHISTLQLQGPVEIDETLLYKIKKGRADGRLAKIRVWLFGIKWCTTGDMVIYPLLWRNKES